MIPFARQSQLLLAFPRKRPQIERARWLSCSLTGCLTSAKGPTELSRRTIILTEGHSDPHTAKTACSVIRYRSEEVVAVLDSTESGKHSGEVLGVGETPIVSALSAASDANTLLIGIAPPGGKIPDAWRAIVLEAISRGMNVVSIEIADGFRRRGVKAKFVATGQTGIMVEGDGLPIDCITADFISGAAEKLVLEHQHHDLLCIEGQGSLVHPSYSAVTLGLLHGCFPHAMVLCYEVLRDRVTGIPHMPIPPLAKIKQLNEVMAGFERPCPTVAISMNSRRVDVEQAEVERRRVADEFGLPVCDVFRDGPETLVDAVESYRDSNAWREANE